MSSSTPHRSASSSPPWATLPTTRTGGGVNSTREITTRTAALAAKEVRNPRHILDVGCGTGQLLGLLATTFPTASELRGIDPAPSMLAVAAGNVDDGRLSFDAGDAEHLPYPDGHFDLVVTTTSFDHWSDQSAGL